MKGREIRRELQQRAAKSVGILALTAVVLTSGAWGSLFPALQTPELTVYVDYTEDLVEVETEEPVLASAPKVTTKTTTKKTTKKIKMKKKATKTYSKKGSTKTTTQTAKTSSTTSTTTKKTVTATSTTDKYTKGSNIDKRVTTVKTTVTTTIVAKAQAQTASADGTYDAAKVAPKCDACVLNAFKALNFSLVVNGSASYSGLCDPANQKITVKQLDDTVYHELGHFMAFVAGNVDLSSSFKAIYEEEKAYYTEYNRGYVLQSSSEYFAESYKNYILNPSALQSSRPKTYAAIVQALNQVTESRISILKMIYGSMWTL